MIRPGYADLAATGGALQGKVERLCRQPWPAALDQAKQAFAARVAAWSKVDGEGGESLAEEREIVGNQDLPEGVETDGVIRCAFALSVATNVDRIARGVVEDWRDGLAYPKAFLGPVPEGSCSISATPSRFCVALICRWRRWHRTRRYAWQSPLRPRATLFRGAPALPSASTP